MAVTNFIEHEGEIQPSYTGVNEPVFPRSVEDHPHSFGNTENSVDPDNIVAIDRPQLDLGDAIELSSAKQRHPSGRPYRDREAWIQSVSDSQRLNPRYEQDRLKLHGTGITPDPEGLQRRVDVKEKIRPSEDWPKSEDRALGKTAIGEIHQQHFRR